MPQYYNDMKNLLISIKITLVFCVILFVGYVLVLWGVAEVTQPNGGRAEVLTLNGRVVGASNVGQQFSDSTHFWSRPSAVDYNGSGSGGSNKGNTNPEYLADVEVRITDFLAAHPYLSRSEVPSEMVTASASGLDPHISYAAAVAQAPRVAAARGITALQVMSIVEEQQSKPIAGPAFINVLKLNIALDEKYNN